MTSGYSKTPLTKKLGLKVNFRVYLHQHPKHYLQLLGDLPEGVEIIQTANPLSLDFCHAFFTSEADLINTIAYLKNGIKHNGILWISWPKGASKLKTDINRDMVRTIVLNAGLVDTKVCAVDNDWSGLKFVYRTKDRK
ncbi:MAG: DUF3052 domain-containing protein [Bacteroidota bacterium]